MDISELSNAVQTQLQLDKSNPGHMDHVLDVLASQNHPCILVGSCAQGWMGSHGGATTACDILVRNNALQSISSDLIKTGNWAIHDTDPKDIWSQDPSPDADIELRRTNVAAGSSEYKYLSLWSEATYRLSVDDCTSVEVPDFYAWNTILIEHEWHPALHRGKGWWYGPRLHPDLKVHNLPERAESLPLFPLKLPRGKGATCKHPIFIPSIPVFLDALVYHKTWFQKEKPGLASCADYYILKSTQYLYLELPHQANPLLFLMEEDEAMDAYLQKYVRKPFFVYWTTSEGEFKSKKVNQWDPESYPE